MPLLVGTARPEVRPRGFWSLGRGGADPRDTTMEVLAVLPTPRQWVGSSCFWLIEKYKIEPSKMVASKMQEIELGQDARTQPEPQFPKLNEAEQNAT